MAVSAPNRRSFGFRLARLVRLWRRELDARLAGVGLTDATWPPLDHIDRAGGSVSQKDLAALSGVETSTLVRLLDCLAAAGLIHRRVSPTDRRVNLVSLTEAGRAALEDIRSRIDSAESEMLADFDDREVVATLDRFGAIERRIAGMRAEREAAE